MAAGFPEDGAGPSSRPGPRAVRHPGQGPGDRCWTTARIRSGGGIGGGTDGAQHGCRQDCGARRRPGVLHYPSATTPTRRWGPKAARGRPPGGALLDGPAYFLQPAAGDGQVPARSPPPSAVFNPEAVVTAGLVVDRRRPPSRRSHRRRHGPARRCWASAGPGQRGPDLLARAIERCGRSGLLYGGSGRWGCPANRPGDVAVRRHAREYRATPTGPPGPPPGSTPPRSA